jgi:hypothetical protein
MTLTVGIAGISGRVGSRLAELLLAQPNINVLGTVRNTSKVAKHIASNPRVKLTTVDPFSTSSVQAGIQGSSVVVCAYGGIQPRIKLEGQTNLIDACIAVGVNRYIASDYTYDYRKVKVGDWPAKDFCIKVAEYLDQRKDKIQAVHILNGGFPEAIFAYGTFLDISTETFSYYGTGDEKWDITTQETAVQWLAAIVQDPTAVGYIPRELHYIIKVLGFADKNGTVVGDQISIKGIAQAYKKVYSRDPKVGPSLGSLDGLYTKMHEIYNADPSNFFSWFVMYV